jgi:hypothetical protein
VLERLDEQLDKLARDDARGPHHLRVACRRDRDVGSRADELDEIHCGTRGLPQRKPPRRVLLSAQEGLQRAHDSGELAGRLLNQQDPLVELRPGLRFGQRELGRSQQADERVRELVERAPREAADRLERPPLVRADRCGLYDPLANRRSVRPNPKGRRPVDSARRPTFVVSIVRVTETRRVNRR